MSADVLPIDAVPFSATRAAVLLAVIHQSHPTVRSVAEYAGVSIETAHRTLTRLRELGLIGWEAGRAHTLRPLVTIEPIGASA